MNPKMIWSNLPVSDLERTTKFYTELGFKHDGNSKQLTGFFVGENDFVIHFFLKDTLKTIINGEITDSQNENEVLFTLSAIGFSNGSPVCVILILILYFASNLVYA